MSETLPQIGIKIGEPTRGWWVMVISALVLGSQAKAEEWKMEQGGIEPGKVMLGMRAGFAPVTQTVSTGTSTDVGSLVNFQAMYSLNNWLLIGMMLEFEIGKPDIAGRIGGGDLSVPRIDPKKENNSIRFGELQRPQQH